MMRVRNLTRVLAAAAALFCLTFSHGAEGQEKEKPPVEPPPVDAVKSLEGFQLAPGLQIELAAAEPQVVDPVAIRFDEDGRMWVVEMRDYPHGPDAGAPPSSTIRILEDENGDGRYEKSTIFADRLLFATGVQPWKGGVIVTFAGQVAYMKDENGDGRADRTETWYRGFAQQNSQLRANHPTLGIDNRIYIANGLRGGEVADARRAKAPAVNISGMDFRFDPHTGEYEAISGVGQFGLTFDDFGRRFVCTNRNPVTHIALANEYLRRNPRAPVAAVTHDVAKAGAASRVFPISRAWTTSTLHAGQFTAACGVTIFRGDLLPKEFRGNVFTCDPTGNFVHREVIAPLGAVFQSKPAREGVEFLASKNEWFRPVNMEVGPDGAMYLVDMHRAVIEHPQFVPEELKQRRDMRWGDSSGRIYRISAKGSKRRKKPKLSTASRSALVHYLSAPNSWHRETAGRLLLERRDRSTIADLSFLATRGEFAPARAHALWLLSSMNALTVETVRIALRDKDPGVREHAAKLSEKFRSLDVIRETLRRLAEDENPRVRFQAALSLTPAVNEEDVAALIRVGLLGADDVWTRRAVTIASGNQSTDLARGALLMAASAQAQDAGRLALVDELVALAASQGDEKKDQQILQAVVGVTSFEGTERLARISLTALIRGAARRRVAAATVLERAGERRAQLQLIINAAAGLAEKRDAPLAMRLESIALLAATPGGEATLSRLSLDDPNHNVRVPAIAALARKTAKDSWAKLLDRFAGESPAIRRAILDGALARADRTQMLLDRIESKKIKSVEIDRVRTDRLLKITNPAIRKRVGQLLADAIPADRKKVLIQYQPVLKMAGDAKRGEQVFRKHCATCHRVANIGVDVAPDIADSRTRQRAQLLADILQPNRAIDSNYISYTVITADGRSITGVLTVETAASITLKQPEGKVVTLARSEIDEIRSNGVSLMPVGLEKNIPPQSMADLILFLKNWRYLDGKTPLSD